MLGAGTSAGAQRDGSVSGGAVAPPPAKRQQRGTGAQAPQLAQLGFTPGVPTLSHVGQGGAPAGQLLSPGSMAAARGWAHGADDGLDGDAAATQGDQQRAVASGEGQERADGDGIGDGGDDESPPGTSGGRPQRRNGELGPYQKYKAAQKAAREATFTTWPGAGGPGNRATSPGGTPLTDDGDPDG